MLLLAELLLAGCRDFFQLSRERTEGDYTLQSRAKAALNSLEAGIGGVFPAKVLGS